MRPLLVYASFNDAIAELWAQVAPGVALQFQEATPPDVEPAACLRVVWLEHGVETPTPGDPLGMVQLSIFTLDRQVALALERAAGLDDGMGFLESGAAPRLQVFNHLVSPPALVGHAAITAMEPMWVAVPDPSPGVIHLARTLTLSRSA